VNLAAIRAEHQNEPMGQIDDELRIWDSGLGPEWWRYGCVRRTGQLVEMANGICGRVDSPVFHAARIALRSILTFMAEGSDALCTIRAPKRVERLADLETRGVDNHGHYSKRQAPSAARSGGGSLRGDLRFDVLIPTCFKLGHRAAMFCRFCCSHFCARRQRATG